MAGREQADMPSRRRDGGRTRRAKRTGRGETSSDGHRRLAGDARDDEEDDGTDPAFAFARSPRVVGITAAAASRRAALVPLGAHARPEVENAPGGGGGSRVSTDGSPPPPETHSRVGGPRGRPGMKFYRARIATRGVSRGVAFEARAARPGRRAPAVVGGAARLGARDRVMVPPHATSAATAADRWHAPGASRDTHLPKLPGRERAGGVPRVLSGIQGKMRIAENASEERPRRASRRATWGGSRNYERPKPRPSPRFHPPPRVDDARRPPRPRA